jgi:phosphoserine aminotransferase
MAGRPAARKATTSNEVTAVATASQTRVFNFSPGPAVLPLPVLERAREELLCLPGAGASVLEISHRSAEFLQILNSAKQNLSRLLSIPDGYQILFLQGGARLQFSMIPMNLLRGQAGPADYILTGSWGVAAHKEAVKEGRVHVAWDGKAVNYDRLPAADELKLNPDAAYAYFTSNETIEGVQFQAEPNVGNVPLICDASSDFLHRPLEMNRYGLIYACAQKNAGPAGVTIVVIRDDLLERCQPNLPGYLNFHAHAEQDSLYNTPPTLAIYIVNLVTEWLLNDIGGLSAMYELNQRKAQLVYRVIDESNGFYRGHAQPECRSLMNVTFRLPSEELEKKFISEAARRSLSSLKGHRSVGGIRASIYNAMPWEGVVALSEFMREFLEQQN